MPREFEHELIAMVLEESGFITLFGHWSPEAPAVQTAGWQPCGGYYATNNRQFGTAHECAVYLCRNLSSVESYVNHPMQR